MYVLQGREGIKGEEGKAGTKRKGREKRWAKKRYMAIFRPLLLSEIQWQYPKNLLPLLHSLVSSVSTQELDCSTGSRKTPAFPRAAPLAKAAVRSVNQPSRSRQTQNHTGLLQADCCLCGCTGKMWQHWNTAIPKLQHHIHGPHSLCMARLGKEAACTGREHEVCTVSKTLPNHKKPTLLDGFYVKKGGGYPPLMHKALLSWV